MKSKTKSEIRNEIKEELKNEMNNVVREGDRVMFLDGGLKFREVTQRGSALGVMFKGQFSKLEELASMTLTGASRFLRWHKLNNELLAARS